MAAQPQNETFSAPPPGILPSRLPVATPKRQFVRRPQRDYSQHFRRSYQLVFRLFNIYLGGTWQTNVPRSVYIELVPQADQASHPMPGDPALNQ